MGKRKTKFLWIGLAFLAAFALWTALVRFNAVQAIGPNGSSVGFATLNGLVHETIGVHWGLYKVTDWLGLIPIGFVLGFAILGLVQLVRRRSLFKVDRSILLALCALPTAMMQLKSRIRHTAVRRAVLVTLGALTAFMVVGRLISGVHWLTDIIGGVLLSGGLVMFYAFVIKRQGTSRRKSSDTV